MTWRDRETNLNFSRGDGRRRFLTLLKVRENGFPERDLRDFGLLLYDGVISDKEFVLLYNEIYLSALKLEREWSSLAIYVLPHFPTLHRS